MLMRLLVVFALTIAVTGIALLVRTNARRRTAAAVGQGLPGTLASLLPGRKPAIVYFYGPHCGACRQQATVLDGLARELDVSVLRVEAASEAILAEALGVLTIPSTVVVDQSRRVRAINLGFRANSVLAAQLQDAAYEPVAS